MHFIVRKLESVTKKSNRWFVDYYYLSFFKFLSFYRFAYVSNPASNAILLFSPQTYFVFFIQLRTFLVCKDYSTVFNFLYVKKMLMLTLTFEITNSLIKLIGLWLKLLLSHQKYCQFIICWLCGSLSKEGGVHSALHKLEAVSLPGFHPVGFVLLSLSLVSF